MELIPLDHSHSHLRMPEIKQKTPGILGTPSSYMWIAACEISYGVIWWLYVTVWDVGKMTFHM